MAVDVAAPREKSPDEATIIEMTEDEHHLATLGYRQVLIRAFGMFESWAATFARFRYSYHEREIMLILLADDNELCLGHARFIRICHVHGRSTGWLCQLDYGRRILAARIFSHGNIIRLSTSCHSFADDAMQAEIAAAMPTTGGIYYWSYKLGGPRHGALLAWLTGIYNLCGWLTIIPGQAQGNTNFMLSLLTILYPESAVIQKGWFTWCIATGTIIVAVIPNCLNQATVRWMLRSTAYCTVILLSFYWIWFPIAASQRNGFDRKIFTTFYNGINGGVD